MAFYEKRYMRNGVPVPIQCIKITDNSPNKTPKFHYHDYTELLFGVSGKLNAYVGSECYSFGAGDMVIVHNHELHDVIGESEKNEYIVVKFLPSILLTGEQTLPEYSYALMLMQNTHTRKNFFHSVELTDTNIPSLFDHLISEWKHAEFGYELSLRADVTVIYMHILRKWREENPDYDAPLTNASHGEILQRALAAIEDNYADITEVSCAASVGVSPSYLSRVFRRGMKISFPDYVNQTRLKFAERLLLSGDRSITDIAECVGFSTAAYFISYFRRVHGITPAKYRKRLRGDN